jgi:hypothetical protein
MRVPTAIKLAFAVLTGLGLFPAVAVAQTSPVEHVVIVGVDRMKPRSLAKAEVPCFRRLMRGGTYTLHARWRVVRPVQQILVLHCTSSDNSGMDF